MNVEEGWDRITEEMKKFDAVFLCDIHSPLRNKLVKFCYAEGIRSYITPKISDIIIRSSEIFIFLTLHYCCRVIMGLLLNKVCKENIGYYYFCFYAGDNISNYAYYRNRDQIV